MPRLVLRAALALVALFTALVGLLRVPPYDAGPVYLFLLPPPGCAAPCWLGIRPGSTSADEAARLLQSHAWIDSVYVDYRPLPGDGLAAWSWSGQQPPGAASSPYNDVRIRAATVSSVHIQTDLRLGEVWLALGPPDGLRRIIVGGQVYIEAVFRNLGALAIITLPCGAPPNDLWQAPASMLWADGVPFDGGPLPLRRDLTRCQPVSRLR